jgi:hypothetical protein
MANTKSNENADSYNFIHGVLDIPVNLSLSRGGPHVRAWIQHPIWEQDSCTYSVGITPNTLFTHAGLLGMIPGRVIGTEVVAEDALGNHVDLVISKVPDTSHGNIYGALRAQVKSPGTKRHLKKAIEKLFPTLIPRELPTGLTKAAKVNLQFLREDHPYVVPIYYSEWVAGRGCFCVGITLTSKLKHLKVVKGHHVLITPSHPEALTFQGKVAVTSRESGACNEGDWVIIDLNHWPADHQSWHLKPGDPI